MAVSLVQRIAVQAAKTFQNSPGAVFQQQLSKLKELMRTLTAEDINFDPDLVRDTTKFNPQSREAPFTYIGLYEDKLFTMGVFVLKNGASLPIHDHPDMFGIVKVIHGSISIKSFSKTSECVEDIPKSVRLLAPPSRWIHSVRVHQTQTLTPPDGVCTLDPHIGNFHEVSAPNTPGAFFDILAPPYDHGIAGNGPRKCRYYHEIDPHADSMVPQDSSISSDARYLVEIPQPLWLWGDHSVYMGPEIQPYEPH